MTILKGCVDGFGYFSAGTPASSTTKSGCHDIAEILLKVVLKPKIKSCYFLYVYSCPYCNENLIPFSITRQMVHALHSLLNRDRRYK